VSDLVLELRAARPVAPVELRERIAELASREPEPAQAPRWSLAIPRFRARRAAFVLVPALIVLAVLGALAGGLASSGSKPEPKAVTLPGEASRSVPEAIPAPHVPRTLPQALGSAAAAPKRAPTLAPNTHRYQDYAASMRIRLDDVNGLSNATERAMRLARRLGGYLVSVQYGTEGSRKGNAYLTLRVPVARVQSAVVRLSGLGTILDQHVAITDVQPQVNALERRIVQLTSDISAIDAQLKSPSLSQAERTRLEFRRERLATARREAISSRTATINRASFATVRLELTTQKREQPAAPAGRFTRTIDKAGGILAAEAAWTLLVLAIVLPFVFVVALLVWGLRAGRRLSDRRLLESG